MGRSSAVRTLCCNAWAWPGTAGQGARPGAHLLERPLFVLCTDHGLYLGVGALGDLVRDPQRHRSVLWVSGQVERHVVPIRHVLACVQYDKAGASCQ